MNTTKKVLSVATLLAASFSMASEKQLNGPKVEVPFSFQVGRTVLPAGQYQVRLIGNALVVVDKFGQSTAVLTHGVEATAPRETSTLEFVKVDGEYQLHRIWRAGSEAGKELSLPSGDRTLAKSEGNTTQIAIGK